MLEIRATFEVNLNNIEEVRNLRDLLNQTLGRLEAEHARESDVEDFSQKNIELLRKFIKLASPKQREVLAWMQKNPGHATSSTLKEALPFLASHGAMPGTFRSTTWKRLSGGSKVGFPFDQIEWNREMGYGVYRGLTKEEANALFNLL